MTRPRQVSQPGVDDVRQLVQHLVSMVEQNNKVASERHRQVENQLGELVARVGRIERCLEGSAEPLSKQRSSLVSDEEVAVKGAKFWIVVLTGGKPTAHEVAIVSDPIPDRFGQLAYYYRRLDGETRGPQTPRPARQFFRTKEDAEACPRPSSAKQRRVSFRGEEEET